MLLCLVFHQNSSQSATARSDKFLNWKFLQSLESDFCGDLINDSTEALRWLESIAGPNMSNLNGLSWDFSSLYDSLSPEFVLESRSFAISELRTDRSPEFVDWILELIDLSLKSCFGKHRDKWYQNKSWIANGGYLSVSLANIAVYYALRCAIFDSDNAPRKLVGFKRFVDDITGFWTGTLEDYEFWTNNVNENLHRLGLSIKDNVSDP